MDKVNIFTVLFCRLVCFIWFLEAVSREMLLGRKNHENTVNADKGQMLTAEQFLTKKESNSSAEEHLPAQQGCSFESQPTRNKTGSSSDV